MVCNDAIGNKHISKCVRVPLVDSSRWTSVRQVVSFDSSATNQADSQRWQALPAQMLGMCLHHITSMRVAQTSRPTPPDPTSSMGPSTRVDVDGSGCSSISLWFEEKLCVCDNRSSKNVLKLVHCLAFVWIEINILATGVRTGSNHRWHVGGRCHGSCCCCYATLNSHLG